MCALLCYYAASSGKWCYSEERTSQLLRGGSLKSRIFCIVVPAVLFEDNFNLLAPEFGIQILAHPVCKM